MKDDDSSAQRLIDYCTRLPEMPGETDAARSDFLWVRQQFEQHRQVLLDSIASGQRHQHELSATRCEIDATGAAISALNELWERRGGARAPA